MIARRRLVRNAALLFAFCALCWLPGSGAQEEGAPDTESPETGASRLYEKALIEYNLGKTRAAYIHLKNALLDDPFLLSAHLLLGKLYLQLGQGEKAEKELLIADGLGAHQTLTLIPLARAYLQQGKSQQLVDELFPLGNLAQEDAELLALRGEAFLDLDQSFEAQRSFTQAWERNPNNINAILGRIRVLLLKGDLGEADFYSRRAAEMAPSNPEVWYLRGRLLRALGDILSSLRHFQRATQVLPAYLPAWIDQTSALLDLSRVDEALEAARKAREQYPRDPRTAYLEAVVQARRGETEAAKDLLAQAAALLSQLPDELLERHPPSLLLAGMVSYGLQQWAQAKSYLLRYLEQFPAAVGPRVLVGQLYLDEHRNEEAVKLLEPAAISAPGDQKVLSLLAEAYLREGQYINASTYLQQALDVGDDNPILRMQRAVNAFALGRRAWGVEEMGVVFDSHPEIRIAGATLVVMRLKERDYDEAVAVARKLLEDDPSNLAYINLYGLTLMTAGQPEAARWAFELALLLDWRFMPAQLNLSELDLRDQKPEAARERLELVLARHPGDENAMVMLARAFEALGRHEEASDWAQRAVGADPGSVSVAVYLSGLLLKMREPEQALLVAESMEARASDSDDIDLIVALSRAYIGNGQKATAQVALQRASGLAGYSATSLIEISALQRMAGDLKGAVWSLEKAVSGDPDYLPARIKLAELYTDIGQGAFAEDVVASLRRDYPKDPFADHLAGVIALARGDNRQALADFRAAFDRRPSSLLAIRVYEAMQAAGEAEGATRFLAQWVKGHPEDRLASQAYAEALFRSGKDLDAEQIYRQALAESPDNALLLNNLALIYLSRNRPEALDLARKAFEIRPDSAEITDTLGWVLVKSGQLEKGLRYLRDAQVRSVEEPVIGYHIAYALNALGRHAEAREAIDQALAKGDDFVEREDAVELSHRLDALELKKGSSGTASH